MAFRAGDAGGAAVFVKGARPGAGDEERASKRRRQGRGLGPFSSTQLTIIIVTLAIVIGFPFAAFAVTGSNVFVTDPVSGVQAHVDAKNNLNTGLHDPVNGTAAGVNTGGQLNVAGPAQAPPATTYESTEGFSESSAGTCETVSPVIPTGKALVVTQVTVQLAFLSSRPMANAVYSASPGSPCTKHNIANGGFFTAASTTQTTAFPSGFPVRTGRVIAIVASGGSGGVGSVIVHGYLVPETQCTLLATDDASFLPAASTATSALGCH